MRRWTERILIGVTVGLVGWDIVAAIEPTPGDTISRVVLDFTRANPIALFGAGVLVGHLLWPQQR